MNEIRIVAPVYHRGFSELRVAYLDPDSPNELEVYRLEWKLVERLERGLFRKRFEWQVRFDSIIVEYGDAKIFLNSDGDSRISRDDTPFLLPFGKEGHMPLSLSSFQQLKEYFRTNNRIRSFLELDDPADPSDGITGLDPSIRRVVKVINENPHLLTSGFSCSGLPEDHHGEHRGSAWIVVSVDRERVKEFEELVERKFGPKFLEYCPKFWPKRFIEFFGLELTEFPSYRPERRYRFCFRGNERRIREAWRKLEDIARRL